MTIHEAHKEQDHASTQVRKYASTLKTSAILIAGLWLGIAGMVSASAESVPVQTTIPSAEDCATDDGENVSSKWRRVIMEYEGIKYKGISDDYTDYTLDEFKTAMNSLLTSPDLINCASTDSGGTVAVASAHWGSVEGAKWAISKGADITTKSSDLLHTPYERALWMLHYLELDYKAGQFEESWPPSILGGRSYEEWKQKLIEVSKMFAPPPAPATKTCAEVDGQTPPANEYCIVAENVQSSVEKDINFIIKGLTGLDEFHTIHSGLSGTGLYQGWTAEFIFTCSALSQGCGESNYNFEHLDKRHSQSLRERIRKDFGFGVFCGDSGNLLDAREVEAGESISFTQSSDTERSDPWYRQCSANSAGPFTLSIKTTRLAQ